MLLSLVAVLAVTAAAHQLDSGGCWRQHNNTTVTVGVVLQ